MMHRAWRMAVWVHQRYPRRWTWALRWRLSVLAHANRGSA